MKIHLSNCRNIDNADISLIEKKLNIKYAINGTGKSTIAKAIYEKSKNANFDDLIPFKYKDKKNKPIPEIDGLSDVSNVLVFNESYISQFAFKQNELISNSFEIFVKTVDYDRHMQQIDSLLSEIKKTFQDNEALSQIITDLSAFIDSFGKAASGYSAAGILAKGIGNGNKVENVPKELIAYTDFIQSDKKVPWLGWQIQGQDYIDISKNCPFCTSGFEKQRDVITKVKDYYDANSIKHLNTILNVIEKLSLYFSEETKIRCMALSKKSDKLSAEEIEYLKQVKQQAIILRDKLNSLRSLSFFNLKDVDKVVEVITGSKIDMDYLQHFKSDLTINIVTNITNSLDQVLLQAGKLQGEVNLQKKTIEDTIRENSLHINNFLLNAGYKYQVSIDYENNEYKLRLRHIDYEKVIENGDQYLSYGEKNALAIVLFMYEAVSKKADLVILDDPISSFDKNKKYAIIDMLFGSGSSLVNKTVMLLTHDFEPIIDLMYTLNKQYSNKVVASFLELHNGILKEKEITKDCIKTFTEICNKNICESNCEIIQLIHLRRHYEITENKGLPYELLSNLFHKRAEPFKTTDTGDILLTEQEIMEATNDIQKYVESFNYTTLLAKVNNNELVMQLYNDSNSNFEKLELYRTLTGEAVGNNILRKYINETFHIENDYVMQLNPREFQVIPYFIIDQCDKELGIT